MVSGLTERRREATRAEILATAEKLFIRNGLRNTSMSQIGEAVGLGRAALYYYFASKDDLVSASVDAIANRFHLLEEASASLTFREAIHRVIEQLVRAVTGPDADLRFLLIALIEQLEDPAEHQVVRATIDGFRAGLAELLQRGKDAGEVLPDVDPVDEATRLTGEILGIEVLRLMDPAYDFPTNAARVERTFIASVTTAQAGPE